HHARVRSQLAPRTFEAAFCPCSLNEILSRRESHDTTRLVDELRRVVTERESVVSVARYLDHARRRRLPAAARFDRLLAPRSSVATNATPRSTHFLTAFSVRDPPGPT